MNGSTAFGMKIGDDNLCLSNLAQHVGWQKLARGQGVDVVMVLLVLMVLTLLSIGRHCRTRTICPTISPDK